MTNSAVGMAVTGEAAREHLCLSVATGTHYNLGVKGLSVAVAIVLCVTARCVSGFPWLLVLISI